MKGNQMGKSSGPTAPADYAALVKESERFKKLMAESQVLTKHEEELMQEWQNSLPEEDFDMLCARWLSFKKWRIWHKPMSEETFMAFCDAALERYPEMDADNLFETGGSYGGFMTNWIIGHTDRFRACASQRSISNWTSFYGVSDIGPDFSEDQCGSAIWPDAEKFWWHSPMKYADRVKTPTLFLHSLEDYRCPVDQGYQMYSALIAHGVESRLVLFRGENHELSRSGKPKHRIRRLNEITGWFEQHRR